MRISPISKEDNELLKVVQAAQEAFDISRGFVREPMQKRAPERFLSHDQSITDIDPRVKERELHDRRPETGFDSEIEGLKTERRQLSERLTVPGFDRMAIEKRIGQIDEKILMLNAHASPQFIRTR